MNNRRSYLDSMNAGRRRRASTSLEELSNTLDELEGRIRGPYQDDRDQDRGVRHHARRLAGEASYYDAPARERYAAPSRERYEQPPARERRPAARDLRSDRYRAAPREDARDFAGELGALREELRQQMGAGLRREFAALKGEIDRAMKTSASSGQAAELGVEFERLSAMIHKLAGRGDDRQLNLLRLEMEEVKNALGKLAREETVRSFDRRWDEFDQRWSDFASELSSARRDDADPALQALSARIEQIGGAIEALPTSVTLRALEERMKALASTVDRFAQQRDHGGPEVLEAIGERLDEISRAVAASAAVVPPAAAIDTEPFERIEARISSLARQLGEAAEDDRTAGLADQLAALSHRVEDIARRVDLPDHAIDRLADQIDAVSRKLDQTPAFPDLDEVFHSLESRFATLSDMLEQRHDDALAQGQALFRDLESRLDEVASRIGRDGAGAAQQAHLIEAMDARFADLASRLESRAAPAPADDRHMRELQARLEAISSRIEASAQQPGVDTDLIRSLESQIAGLASHIIQPVSPATEGDDILPRLDKIERSIAESRQDVLEAARHAAEEAVRGLAARGGDGAAALGLVDDLKSLEALTRKSDDRNARTFEAIHDTLLKIVDRLGAIEAERGGARNTVLSPGQTPSLDPDVDSLPLAAGAPARSAQTGRRTAAAAAAEAAAEAVRSDAEAAEARAGGGRRSMLGGLTRALSGRKGRQEDDAPETAAAEPPADDAAPAVELDAPLDPQIANQPLEPGSGAPDLNAIMKRVRDERGEPQRGPDTETAKSDFIAAARRAAQAAAAEAEMMKRSPSAKAKAGGFSLGGLIRNRRKPVLMGVAAVLLALAALQVGRSFTGGGSEVAQTPAPATAEVAAIEDETPQLAEAAELPAEPQQAVRMAGEAAPPRTAQSLMTVAPETADDVTNDWLDAETTASAMPAAEPAPEALSEVEVVPEPSEEMLAAIPLEAGPAALREAAAAGDPKALLEIGNRYAEGRGVTEDMAKAAEWYEQAAEQGLAPAQYRVGNLYEKGVGVRRDVAKAKTWYQLAAAQGNASAMHNLAVLHAMGADGTTDNDSAARWFTQAAELGVRDSQFNLGILSAKGVGVPQDLEAAYKWFALAAKTGDKDAAEKRDEVANALRPDQLENARAAAELWRAKEVDPEANTVEIPDGWSESNEATAGIDMKQAVRNIQQILNNNGYDAGAEDGLFGRKTQTAIAAFQKDNGMEPTGEIDEKLVRALLDKS